MDQIARHFAILNMLAFLDTPLLRLSLSQAGENFGRLQSFRFTFDGEIKQSVHQLIKNTY